MVDYISNVFKKHNHLFFYFWIIASRYLLILFVFMSSAINLQNKILYFLYFGIEYLKLFFIGLYLTNYLHFLSSPFNDFYDRHTKCNLYKLTSFILSKMLNNLHFTLIFFIMYWALFYSSLFLYYTWITNQSEIFGQKLNFLWKSCYFTLWANYFIVRKQNLTATLT